MTQVQSILIVDDSSTIRDMLAYDLRMDNFICSTASNGLQAMDMLSQEKFDFVITDVDMPEMDGFGLIRAMSALENTPGVILISGRDVKSLYSAQQLALAYSVDLLATLSKPVDQIALIKALQTVSKKGRDTFGKTATLSESEFMRGLMTDGLVPVYQPKIDAKTGEFRSVETFARWKSESGSLMGAHSVITIAREKGYTDVFTYRMLELAVEQASKWKEMGLNVPISVNLAADNLRKNDFCDVVSGLVEQYGISTDMVTLEIGEAEMVMDEKQLIEVMGRLHVRGFRLALDDFGTGFGSLMRLQTIPFDELNIDRRFLEKACEDKVAFTILGSVVDLARKLSITSSSCGVSNQVMMDMAKSIGIDYVQGYHLGNPMKADEFVTWLEEYKSN